MAQRTWMKYLGLMAAFTGIAGRVFPWLQQAQAAGSPGGDDIVPEEVAQLQDVITQAINTGLQAAEVPIIANVTLTYIGE